MVVAPVDSTGGRLFFQDSGPVPESTTYTTLVIYHGTALTGESFRKVLPLFPRHNIRAVVVNRRHYPGSARFQEAQLDDLRHGREGYLHVVAQDVANFLAWFIDNEHVTPRSRDNKSGGLAILGWSSGGPVILSLFGQPDVIPKRLYAKIEPYLRAAIIYDSPMMAYGYSSDPPPGVSVQKLAEALRTPEHFMKYVTGWFDHDLSSRSYAGLDYSWIGKDASIDHITPEELQKIVDPAAAFTADLGPASLPVVEPMLHRQADRALYDEELARSVLPDVRFTTLVCTRSGWHMVLGALENEKRYTAAVASGKIVRPNRFIDVKNANHLLHWDDPETFCKVVAEALS
ncbi:uncharacterized protein ARMOST_01759 [Armillaria ostoyae]|uniref:AB hydrolase-1 domain-containing protein n=1 Tax=Armillaria ostoyae TaxID=47428 RepID=A0A284QPX5_ARMOS|nr:uncharacterized protein ARMOST_01759 [Armillaria ostoyae]